MCLSASLLLYASMVCWALLDPQLLIEGGAPLYAGTGLVNGVELVSILLPEWAKPLIPDRVLLATGHWIEFFCTQRGACTDLHAKLNDASSGRCAECIL